MLCLYVAVRRVCNIHLFVPRIENRIWSVPPGRIRLQTREVFPDIPDAPADGRCVPGVVLVGGFSEQLGQKKVQAGTHLKGGQFPGGVLVSQDAFKQSGEQIFFGWNNPVWQAFEERVFISFLRFFGASKHHFLAAAGVSHHVNHQDVTFIRRHPLYHLTRLAEVDFSRRERQIGSVYNNTAFGAEKIFQLIFIYRPGSIGGLR